MKAASINSKLIVMSKDEGHITGIDSEVESKRRRRTRRGRKQPKDAVLGIPKGPSSLPCRSLLLPSQRKQNNDDDTATVTSSGSDQSHVMTHHHQHRAVGKPKHPLTKAQKEQYLAMDCEMVGVGLHGQRSALARITLVNWYHDIVYDTFVKPNEEVTDYRYFVSGITELDLQTATLDLDMCRNQVAELIEGKILVGHALKNDLAALRLTHPWYLMRDTAKYEPFMKLREDTDNILWPRKLKELVYEKLKKEIQPYGTAHCPIQDAVAALQLYKLVRVKWEAIMDYKVGKTAEIHCQQLRRQAATLCVTQ